MANKVLCMCQGGNSRSVALGFLMKYRYGEDALACSWEKNSPETLKMLFEWADRIFVMQEHFRRYVPVEYHEKLYVVDVGIDRWANGLHPELHALIVSMLEPKITKCAKCGKEMECNPSGDCWCKSVAVVDMPRFPTGCFCRECLMVLEESIKDGKSNPVGQS